MNKKNFHCYKKYLKWGDEVMKKVSPIIKCPMLSGTFGDVTAKGNSVRRVGGLNPALTI